VSRHHTARRLLLFSALASLLVGHFYDGHSAHAMAWVMLGCAALALLCFACGIRALAGAPPPAHSAGAQ